MMGKLLIYNNSDFSDSRALWYVQQVMEQGRVSGDSYCYATRFKDGTMVYADKLKSGDKFRIEGYE